MTCWFPSMAERLAIVALLCPAGYSDPLMHKLHCETSGLCRTSSRRSSEKVCASTVVFLFPVFRTLGSRLSSLRSGCQAACRGSMVQSLWFSLASLASGTQNSDSATRTAATVVLRFWLEGTLTNVENMLWEVFFFL